VIRYLDASALAKRYVDEAQSENVRRLLTGARLSTCRLTEVEVTSALVRRAREGSLSERERDRGIAALRTDLAALTLVELVPEVTALAGDLLRRHPLRGADAVQLASALVLRRRAGTPVELLAFDQRLNQAAAKEGLGLPTAASQ
jgi:uncharacterized protein